MSSIFFGNSDRQFPALSQKAKSNSINFAAFKSKVSLPYSYRRLWNLRNLKEYKHILVFEPVNNNINKVIAFFIE